MQFLDFPVSFFLNEFCKIEVHLYFSPLMLLYNYRKAVFPIPAPSELVFVPLPEIPVPGVSVLLCESCVCIPQF